MTNDLIANRYSIGALIEQGGMGDVHLGHDLQSGQPVAIKLLKAELGPVAEAAERFEREGAALRSLDHPNIVRLLAMDSLAGRRCLVMEYIAGGSLEELLRRQPRLPVQQALRLLIDLADALARVHQHGLLHRDIKPSNVLLDAAGNPHLTDFGIAALSEASNLTPSGAVIGTYAYLSPEACAGEKLDPRADIWSLGVLLYEVLAGRRPFEGSNPAAIIGAIMYRPIPDIRDLRPDISPGLAILIARMLVKQRDDRLGSARLVAAAAEALWRGDPMPLPALDAHVVAAQAAIAQEDREHLENLLQIHRRNLKLLERKAAMYGAGLPLDAQNQLEIEHEQIAQIEAQLGVSPQPTPSPQASSVTRTRTNLPTPPTALIGRAREVAQAQALLRQPDLRLLTLSGPGGSGKTRLSLDIAAGMLGEFADGVWFVDLTPIRAATRVAATIAQAIAVKEEGGGTIAGLLKAALRETQLLLVIDNFEQVLDAAALIADLLAACPGLKLLITSRARLQIAAEREFPVNPLATPDPRHALPVEELGSTPAVALFVRAAQIARPGFTLNSENASAIASICRKLDGLPLALELAAARCKLLAPHALLQRLDRRLDLLKGGARDLASRQQTLRSAIDWSYDLLTLGEQSLFARMAVFSGGCTFEQVEAVCASHMIAALEIDPLDGVASLVDKSLVRQTEDDHGEPLFTMLETIREYAGERLKALAEELPVKASHAAYFAALAQEAEPHLTGPDQQLWLARLEREHDNLRAALDWLLKHEAVGALALAGALWRFWYTRGHLSEGREWLEKALRLTPGAPPAAAATALNGVGGIAWAQGDYVAATGYLERAIALYQQLGDKGGLVRALNILGVIAQAEHNYDQAQQHFMSCLAQCQEMAYEWGMANALSNLGLVAQHQHKPGEAEAFHVQSLALRRRIDDQRGIAISLFNIAEIAILQGKYTEAEAHLRENIVLLQILNDLEGIAFTIELLAKIISTRGQVQRSIILWGAAAALRARITAQMPPDEQADYDAAIAAARAIVSPADVAAAWEQGQTMSFDAAIALAIEATTDAR